MAEQEYVRAYQRTLASGKTVQVTAHNRTNTDVGTAARKVPGRPPMVANAGNMANGRTLPGIWVLPDPQGAAKAAGARATIQQNQTDERLATDGANQAAKETPKANGLTDIHNNPHVPKDVANFARKLGLHRTTLPAKDTGEVRKKLLGDNPPPEVAAYAKKLGLSHGQQVARKLKNLKHHDPGLVSLAAVHVDSYTRRNKAGKKERVRQYVRHEDLAPDMGAKKGTFSGVAPQQETPETFPEISREQFSNPDTPRTRGVTSKEFQAITLRGKNRMDQLRKNSSTPEAMMGTDWDKLKQQGWDSVQSEWGGITADTHSGHLVTDDGTDQFALTVKPLGMDSESVPVGASQAEFNAAMERAKTKFASELSMENAHLGVFRDDAINRIDIDPVLILRDRNDAEAVGAYTQNVGGAYNFRDGNGYWPPYVIQGPSDGRQEGLPQGTGAVASAGSGGSGEGPPGAIGWGKPKQAAEVAAPLSAPVSAALKGANPNYDPSVLDKAAENVTSTRKMLSITDLDPALAYNFNCFNAVTAFEMRMRGQNVSARPVHNLHEENNTDKLLARWAKPNGQPLVWSDLTHTKNLKGTNKLAQSWGDGGRGFVVVQFKKDSGHIFVMINDGGKIRYLDAQSGKEYPASLFGRVAPGMVYVVRSNNLALTNEEAYVQ